MLWLTNGDNIMSEHHGQFWINETIDLRRKLMESAYETTELEERERGRIDSTIMQIQISGINAQNRFSNLVNGIPFELLIKFMNEIGDKNDRSN